MPTYTYKCEKCENAFERILKISERKTPTEEPCEKCGGNVKQTILQTTVGDPFALGRVKLNDGMKNVLDKVRRAPGASHVKSRFEDL